MKILITGSSGYVGNVLAAHFTSLGWSVVGCDLIPLDRQSAYAGFSFRHLDVTDASAVNLAFREEQPDHVIHLAYLMDPQHDAAFEEHVDVQGSVHVFRAAESTPSVKQFILFSSTSAYGAHKNNARWIQEDHPLAPNDYVYGQHKTTVEEQLRKLHQRPDLRFVIVRMCTAVGPSYYKPGGVVSTFSKAPVAMILDGRDLEVQWLHEDDLTALIERIANDATIEGAYNLVPDTYTSTRAMAHALHKRPLSLPSWLFRGVISVLWTLRLANISPPMVRLMQYGIVASPDTLKARYQYTFKKSSLEAFLDAVEKRRARGLL